ncbi:MAG: peptidylprolyl isomerase [Planctomycetales bacterium]|nr:peptidylprolyl isomerase [Planctomycetales bacterium]
MNGTDGRSSARPGAWKKWIIGFFPALALVAAAVVFRGATPPREALAQAPVKSTPKGAAGPAASGPSRTGTPARQVAGPAAPSRTAPSTGNTSGDSDEAPVVRGAGAKAPPSVTALSVVAVVNSEQITKTDLGRECLRRYGPEVLDTLLNKLLLADALAAKGITITDKDITEEIDRIAGKFGLPRDRWLALLKEERKFTEAQYRREVVWPMLALRKASAMDVKVSKEEVKAAFESEYGPKVRCRLIILDAAKHKDVAPKILAALKADPKQFGKLAQQYCEDPSVASASGVIPPIALHTGDPAIEEAAFRLQKGQTSGVIPVAEGKKLVILRCEDHIPEQYIGPKDLPAVQKKLEERIRDNKTRFAASQFFAEVHKRAKIVNVLADPSKKKDVPSGAVALVNGKQITYQQLTDECLVRFGGDVLDGEINRKLFTQELARRKVQVGEQDIQAEIARAAESNGYIKSDKTPDVERWVKDITTQDNVTAELYRTDAVWPSVALKKLCASRVQVSEADLQKGFESNYGERVRVLAIVLSDQRQAQRVWDMARNNPTDTYFSQLAQQYSVEPSSRANGGEVPPICKHSGSPVIEKEAFALKAGELSGIIAMEDQFILLRCLGRTEPVQRDMAAVKNELYKDLYEKKLRNEMNREFERIHESAQIDNFLAGTSQAPKSKAAGSATGSVRPALDSKGGIAPASATLPRTGSTKR